MPPAVTAVYHLFVRQHGAALRAPVHAALFPVRQPSLQHAQEEPLVPAVIFRLASRDFPSPVVAEPEAPQHALKFRDIFVSPLTRVSIIFDRRVFRRQAESAAIKNNTHPREWTNKNIAE